MCHTAIEHHSKEYGSKENKHFLDNLCMTSVSCRSPTLIQRMSCQSKEMSCRSKEINHFLECHTDPKSVIPLTDTDSHRNIPSRDVCPSEILNGSTTQIEKIFFLSQNEM